MDLFSSAEKAAQHIQSQFNDPVAQQELQDLGPENVDWIDRTQYTLDVLLPRLPALAQYLSEAVPRRLNSPSRLLSQLHEAAPLVEEIAENTPKFIEWYKKFVTDAEEAKSLIGNLESQQISAEIQRMIASPEGLGDLVYPNGNSIYPDLILLNHTYDFLPVQNRKNPIDGPCLRGKRPSNVPDGCEIKTNKGSRIRVDAHGAHSGLHLGVTWDLQEGEVVIDGVWAAYVRIADHRESGRNVKVTTVKFSFGHELFVSLL